MKKRNILMTLAILGCMQLGYADYEGRTEQPDRNTTAESSNQSKEPQYKESYSEWCIKHGEDPAQHVHFGDSN